ASGAAVSTRTTAFAYDPLGYRQVSATNALDYVATVTWDSTLRRVSSSIDSNDLSTSYGYDAFDRLIQVSRPDGSYTTLDIDAYTTGGFELRVTQAHYDALGITAGTRRQYLDGFGRLRLQELELAVGGTSKMEIAYDDFGRV